MPTKRAQEATSQSEPEEASPLANIIENLKDIIQDCNISFLIGSGLSNPFMATLGNIEVWLTELDENMSIDDELKTYVKACLYKCYFDVAMKDNLDVLKFTPLENEYTQGKSTKDKLNNTYKSYKDFITIINSILYSRRSNTVSKQVNLFTTNIDIFLEKVIEDLDYQFNDGFNGIFKKRFGLSNFKKSFYQKSLQYDNISEIPVFNLLKIHGSVTWQSQKGSIIFTQLTGLKKIDQVCGELAFLDIISLNNKKWKSDNRHATLSEIIKAAESEEDYPDLIAFSEEYEKLQIVNPTKEKFKDTTFNKNYYEILRLYSNELEKENSVLFIMGFSMADEHIREITIRAIKSNPTLKVYIVSYLQSAQDIISNLGKDGIRIESLPNMELINPQDGFDLKLVNELIFNPLLASINLQ